VKYLAGKEVKVCEKDDAFRYASLRGHLSVVKFLVESCDKITESYYELSIEWAKLNNKNNVVEYLKSLM
ncbi:MAG: hypothetical protein R3213_10210, partial [Flavobacteriaceae bacterium]|nr:hypothetical protein [Flavobacteriaceae bacterium]